MKNLIIKNNTTNPLINSLNALLIAATINLIYTPSILLASDNQLNNNNESIFNKVIDDYKNLYSFDRLPRFSLVLTGSAIIANTKVDNKIQTWYQNDIRSSSIDDYSKTAKLFGEGKYLIPIALLSAGAHYFFDDSLIGSWGSHTTRAYLVGFPALLVSQAVLGASRPGESSEGSQWQPFKDNNGVSGHAFIGAVPFLTIAKMNDNLWIKTFAYGASALTALSRVNDNQHFLSQAALGWYLAWEAVDAVYQTGQKKNNLTIMPMINEDAYGIAIHFKW